MECCGHLSAFEIGGVSYEIEPEEDLFWGRRVKSMDCKLASVLRKDMTFGYEYDFGSTTKLMITVVNYRIRTARKEKRMLPDVCNSPRMGVCGYCGSAVCPEQFIPDV